MESAGAAGAAAAPARRELSKNSITLHALVEALVNRCYVDCVASLARTRERTGSGRREEVLRAATACKQRLMRLAIVVEWVRKNVRCRHRLAPPPSAAAPRRAHRRRPPRRERLPGGARVTVETHAVAERRASGP